MRMRPIVWALALILLASMGASAQTYSVGAPTGSGYNLTGAAAALTNTNFAVSIEGRRELFAPISICTSVVGGGGGAASFDVGDQFRILYGSNVILPGTPFTLTPGIYASSTGNLTVTGTGLAATATADTVATPSGPTAQVTITITSAPTIAGSCLVIHNLRFDVGGTVTTPSLVAASVITISVSDVTNNVAVPLGVPAIGAALSAGFPVASSNVATVNLTMGTGAAGSGATISTGTGGALAAPAGFVNTGVSIPTLTQNSGASSTGTVNVVQALATGNVNAGTGNGLLRPFITSGGSTTTFLNLSGATNGTQVQIDVQDMPAGTTVVFPATANSGGGTPTMVLTGGGTVTAPSGQVLYTVTTNGGTGAVVTVPVPYTVTASASGGGTGTARVIVRVRPDDTTTSIPRYNQINSAVGSTVVPAQPTTPVASSQFALFAILPNTTNMLFSYVLVDSYPAKASTYDTGIAIANTGQDPFGTANATRTIGQDGTFTFYFFPDKSTNATNTAVGSIKSDAANFPNAATLETGGRLAQGNTYQALLSELLTASGVTAGANWKGYMICITDFQFAHGFAFISQFYNANGGATMGYQANVFATTARAATEVLNH